MSTRNDYTTEELAEWAQMLWPARMVMDYCAAGRGCDCESMAQRVADLIGHSVTDYWPRPHLLIPLELAEALVDDGDCRFDHHGGCRDHGYLSLEPGEKCPQQELKELVAQAKGPTE